MSRFMKIRGVTEVQDNVSEISFTDTFIDFIEKNGWYFGGGISEVSEEGIQVAETGQKRLVLSLTKDEAGFLLDILEEAMLLPYENEEGQKISENIYTAAKEQLSE